MEPDDASRFLDESGHFGSHPQRECRIASRALGEEAQEVPLRHERDEPALRRQMGEVRDRQRQTVDLPIEPHRFLMWQLQQILEKS